MIIKNEIRRCYNSKNQLILEEDTFIRNEYSYDKNNNLKSVLMIAIKEHKDISINYYTYDKDQKLKKIHTVDISKILYLLDTFEFFPFLETFYLKVIKDENSEIHEGISIEEYFYDEKTGVLESSYNKDSDTRTFYNLGRKILEVSNLTSTKDANITQYIYNDKKLLCRKIVNNHIVSITKFNQLGKIQEINYPSEINNYHYDYYGNLSDITTTNYQGSIINIISYMNEYDDISNLVDEIRQANYEAIKYENYYDDIIMRLTETDELNGMVISSEEIRKLLPIIDKSLHNNESYMEAYWTTIEYCLKNYLKERS